MNLLRKLKLWWHKHQLRMVNADIRDCETMLADARRWRATVKQMIEVMESEK